MSQWSLRDKSTCVTYHATPISFVHAPLMLLAMRFRHKSATHIGVCNRSFTHVYAFFWNWSLWWVTGWSHFLAFESTRLRENWHSECSFFSPNFSNTVTTFMATFMAIFTATLVGTNFLISLIFSTLYDFNFSISLWKGISKGISGKRSVAPTDSLATRLSLLPSYITSTKWCENFAIADIPE